MVENEVEKRRVEGVKGGIKSACPYNSTYFGAFIRTIPPFFGLKDR